MCDLTYKNQPCRILGNGEAVRPCDCCGNTYLEKVVFIEVEGQVLQIGRVCASKAIYGRADMAAKLWKKAEEAARRAKRELKEETERAAHRMVHALQTESDPRQQALYLYISTGRKSENRRLFRNGDWWVAVDTGCQQDVARWQGMGFSRLTPAG